jgi:hypothetical protein
MGAQADEGKVAEAREHYKRGLVLFNGGLFEAAQEEFETGYRLSPRPLFLYNAAQAARRANRPAKALELYRRYVVAEPGAAEAQEAAIHIRALEEQLGPDRIVPKTPEPPPPVEPPPVPATPAPPPAARWYHDRIGGALLGAGVVALVAGVIMTGVAGDKLAVADRDYDSFEDAQAAKPLAAVGGVLLATGVGLSAGAAGRYAVVARRLRIGATIAPRHAGISLSTSF